MGIKRLRCSATDREFSDKNWKRRGILKNWSIKMHETGLLDLLTQEVADHAHPAVVWCSVEQSLIGGTVDQWPAHLRVCV